MKQTKTIADWMTERGLALPELIAAAGLDARVVKAIVAGQYTSSPQQRQRLAAALGVSADEIAWGHTVPISHVYGHGPQFGRSP